MAEQARQHAGDDQRDAGPANQPDASGKPVFWKRFLTLQWFAVLLAVTVIVQGGVLAYRHYLARPQASTPEAEVSLGVFDFKARQTERGRIAAAKFSLHIALLQQVGEEARQRLQTHKYRVQQDIEELLRQAHSGDFDDPSLAELKRQLQEQVNETLGIRAIADVIITDLQLAFNEKKPDSPATETAELVPWVEKPSS